MSKYKRYEKYKDSGIEWIGEIPEHWEINKLKRLSNIITGNTPSKSEEENYDDEGIPWVKPDNIQDDGTVSETKERLSVIGLQKARLIPKNSAIVCCIGTVGKVGFTQQDCTTNQQINSIIFDRISIWNSKYGFYCLYSSKNEHEKYSNKVVVSILNKTQQGNIIMPVPSLDEQKTIASFLDQKTAVIDDLIADKEKLIELLQEKRQAIITEAVTKGLNPNVKMKDSGIEWIGEIPEHWRIVRLKFLKTSPFQYGANEPAEMDDPQLPRYIRITDINEKGDLREDTFKSLSWESAQPYLLKDGDILFARSGATVGKTFMYRGELGPACYAGYLIRFKPDKSKVNSYYIYYYTLSKVYEEWIKQNIIQATIQNVSAEKYGNLQVPLPPLEEQKGIVKYLNDKIEEIDILVESIYVQIQKLKEYRQSLISEAVTGKIDVRDYDVSN